MKGETKEEVKRLVEKKGGRKEKNEGEIGKKSGIKKRGKRKKEKATITYVSGQA